MTEKKGHIDYLNLITKKLSDEISLEEDHQLQAWLDQNHENKMVFDSYKATWEEMDRVNGKTSMDLESEWERLEQAIDFDEESSATVQKSLFPSIYRVAAVFMMLAVAAFSIYFFTRTKGPEVLVAQLEIEEVKLEEGSVVTVNSNSTFTYPKEFDDNKREVQLSGEAYFEVAKDPERPFIIDAGTIQIEVLGTSFNVKAYEAQQQIEVIVSSGKVAVYNKDNPNERVVLIQGQKATFFRASTKIEKSTNEDINFAAWKTKAIIFEDTPMPEVIRIINEIYKTNLSLKGDQLNECPVTTTFDNQSLESVLNVLESTLDLTIEKQDGQIKISGEGC